MRVVQSFFPLDSKPLDFKTQFQHTTHQHLSSSNPALKRVEVTGRLEGIEEPGYKLKVRLAHH